MNSEGIELPAVRCIKIGPNSSSIKKTINFSCEQKPVLLVGEADAKKELESIAAIRRKVKNA